MSVDDVPRSGHPSTSSDDAHMTKLMKLCVLIDVFTVRGIVEDCNISVGLCHEILEESHIHLSNIVRPRK